MAQFFSLLYVTNWLCAPLAAKVPSNDLGLNKKLLRYRRVDEEVAQAALSTMRRHMAYLKPETVVLSLASKSVNAKEKTAMAQRLLTSPRGCNDAEEDVISSTRIQESSWLVFRLIRNEANDWLQEPANTWRDDQQYKDLERLVNTMKITNDVAEKGVAMIGAFSDSVTKDKRQLQWLLQVVESSCKKMKSFRKQYLDTL